MERIERRGADPLDTDPTAVGPALPLRGAGRDCGHGVPEVQAGEGRQGRGEGGSTARCPNGGAGSGTRRPTRRGTQPSSRSAARSSKRSLDARLGVEPLGEDFTTEHLYLQTRNRRAPIKAVLLDQRRIAGVGNIYANEALFRAAIHPLREARRLKRAQVAALRDAVVASLQAGLSAGGATIDDFRHPDGVKGAFQNEFLVHGRDGEPCLVCGSEVRKFVAAGRGTYACESCQVRPRRRRR